MLSKLYFCADKLRSPFKSHLACIRRGTILATRMIDLEGMDNKTRRFWIRLSPEEDAMFKEKASNYQTISAMVRDAVRQFNDIGTVRKIEALTEMTALFRKYQQDLAWLGGNFNQAMKRANELAIGGELSQSYYEKVILPQLTHILDFLEKVKDEQHKIAIKLRR